MTPFKSLFIVIASLGLIVSCRNDNEYNLDPANKPQIIDTTGTDTTGTDTTGTDTTVVEVPISLSGDVNPIFTKYNCTSSRCHGSNPGAGQVNLTTYNKLKVIATSGQLYGSISHASGYSRMPDGGGKLTDPELALIKKWIDAGAPNN